MTLKSNKRKNNYIIVLTITNNVINITYMTILKKAMSRAVSKILDPLIHLLLQQNISHSEFSELARRSYVKIAFKHFTIPSRIKTNSRVSVITGLSRPEVARLAALAGDEEPVTKGPLNRATRVIGGWLQDQSFVDQDGQPRILALRGETNSFDDLVTQYSGGITSRAILDELIRVGAVSKVDKQHVKLTQQGFVPSSNADTVEMVFKHAGDMLGTISHNLSHVPEQRRFQRQVSYIDIPESIDHEFKVLCHEKSLETVLELNRWLADKKKTVAVETNDVKSRVGLGIYYFKNEVDEDER